MAVKRGDGVTQSADGQIDPRVLERCRRIATATWSDALDSLGIEGVVDGLQVRSGSARIAGAAVTVTEQAAPLGTFELARFDVGGIIEAARGGTIPVVTMGGAEVSTFGGLSARAAVQRGIPGIVIDGGCRDIDEIREVGLYVASRHVTPRSGKLRISVTAIGEPVTCGGVIVNSGDCVIADQTGVVVIPAGRLSDALGVAEHLAGNDRTFEQQLAAGAGFRTVSTRLGHL